MAAKQDKAGWVVTLRIKTEEATDPQNRQFILDWVGSRYMLVMARIADNEEIVVPDEVVEGKRLVQSAAMLCNDPNFQKWLVDSDLTFDAAPDLAAEALRAHLGIKSRADLRDNKSAQLAFKRLMEDFYNEGPAPLEEPIEEPIDNPAAFP